MLPYLSIHFELDSLNGLTMKYINGECVPFTKFCDL